MRKIGYIIAVMVIASLVIAGSLLQPVASDQYVVGGEIVPVNVTSYLLNPYMLAAIAAAIILIIASLTIERFPVKISVEKA